MHQGRGREARAREPGGRVSVNARLGALLDRHAGAGFLELALPEAVAGLEELRNDPEELRKGPLTGLVFGLTGEVLREGVTFAASADLSNGIHIRMKDKNITFDLTEAAVAALLLQHLQPRFRAILEGVVK